jgi:hypothetical protein
LERLWTVNSLATVTLRNRKMRIIQTKPTRDQMFGTAACNLFCDGGKDRVLYVYSVVQGRHKSYSSLNIGKKER